MVKRAVLPFKARIMSCLVMGKLLLKYAIDLLMFMQRKVRSKSHNKIVCETSGKPKSLQLPITNMCNLRCKTCNVFHLRTKELTVDDIKEIAKNPFMNELENVGINGGEPFLRQDLIEIVNTLCTLPNLTQISVISNGILTSRILKRLKILKEICNSHQVRLQFTTSIDGIDFVHDNIRGKNNAFDRTMSTFMAIKENMSTYCDQLGIISTISLHNIFYINELEAYLSRNNIENITYQLAVDHNRLENASNEPFSVLADKKAHEMALEFFYMLYTKTHSRKYFAIYRYLNDYPNQKRMSWCPFFSSNITIDASGGIAYCATHSPVVGNIKENTDIEKVYYDNLDVKREVIDKNCNNCIHYSRNNLMDYAEIEYLNETLFLELSKIKFKV